LSENVVKELSIASEAHRPIVPVELEAVTIPSEFKYQIAGLQRAQYTDFDSILRAFARLAISHESGDIAPQKLSQPSSPLPVTTLRSSRKKYAIGGVLLLLALAIGACFLFFSKKPVSGSEDVKTLTVLPFESLSADKDNDFFADGMTATLIDMLVSIPELRVTDRKTSMEYKSTKVEIKTLASELGCRYFVTGTVQRQGDQLLINVQMTDAETGTVLLSKPFSGKTEDLLELQKQIAESIAVELTLALYPDNDVYSSDRRSSHPKAHELSLKTEYADDHGEMDTAIAYYQQATKYDSSFAWAYMNIARIYGNKYMADNTVSHNLTLADSFLVISKRLDTAQVHSHFVGSWIATVHGDFDKSIAEATAYIKKRPRQSNGYYVLGLAYINTKQYELSAQNFMEVLKRDPANMQSRFLAMLSLWCARDTVRLQQFSSQAIPIFEAWLTRHPDDKPVRNNSIPLALVWSGRGDEACKRMEQLIKTQGVDSEYFLNTAAISALSGKLDRAMELMRQEVTRLGIKKVDFDRPFFDNIRHFPEFQAWEKQKEALTKKNG